MCANAMQAHCAEIRQTELLSGGETARGRMPVRPEKSKRITEGFLHECKRNEVISCKTDQRFLGSDGIDCVLAIRHLCIGRQHQHLSKPAGSDQCKR